MSAGLRYLSVCSGIEAATVAWHPLGWVPAAFAEIEAFPSAVLAHHYPDVPNWGDVTRFKDWPDADVDVLVGGTPCQSFSVAGLRKGLADPRGNIMLTYLGIAQRYRPRWLVWENVPGALSVGKSGAFAAFIGGLAAIGYHAAWRVLDAQYVRVDGFPHAVPQRRQRVFVVGYLGDWRCAGAVLLERESLQGNPAPRREAGQGVAPTISARPTGGGGLGTDFDLDGGLITSGIARCLNAGAQGRIDGESETFVAHALRADGFDASEDGTGRGTPLVTVADTLVSNGDAHSGYRDEKGLVPFTLAIRGRGDTHQLETRRDGTANAVLTPNGGRAGIGVGAVAARLRSNVRNTSNANTEAAMHVVEGWAVRRLTPTECERLQGFPDAYTAVPYRGKPAADGPRYKALGNSMAVNAMRWLGSRIQMVTDLSAEIGRAA